MGKLLLEGENSLVTDGNNKKIYKFFNNLIVNWKRGRKILINLKILIFIQEKI